MEKINPVLIDEEFNKEINTQIELVTKLEKENLHVKSDQLSDDLNSLYNSLYKLSKNEIFLLNFKNNQILQIEVLKSIKILIQSNEDYYVRTEATLILSLLLDLINTDEYYSYAINQKTLVDYYETYFLSIAFNLIEIFMENNQNVNDIKLLNSILDITLFMTRYCSIYKLVLKDYITQTLKILNPFLAFSIIKYATIIRRIAQGLKKTIGDIGITMYTYHLLDNVKLILDGVCIIKRNMGNSLELKKDVYLIIDALSGVCFRVYFLNSETGSAELKSELEALKNKIIKTAIDLVRQELSCSKTKGSSRLTPDCFDIIDKILDDTNLKSCDLVIYCDELARLFCEALICLKKHETQIQDSSSGCWKKNCDYHIERIFLTFSHMIGKNKITLSNFFDKYWNAINPIWSRYFLDEDHVDFNPSILMGAMVSSVNVETETYLISFFISKFTELFSIELLRKTTKIDSATSTAFYELVKFLYNNQLEHIFNTEMVPLLHLYIRKQEKMEFIDWLYTYFEFYNSLFGEESELCWINEKPEVWFPHFEMIINKLNKDIITSFKKNAVNCIQLNDLLRVVEVISDIYLNNLTQTQLHRINAFTIEVKKYFEFCGFDDSLKK